MVNYLNLFAGYLSFFGASILAYGLYNPVMSFLNVFPTELFVICGMTWVTFLFWGIVYTPMMMLVSDDRGQ